MLENKLQNYINQTEDPVANYELGLEYEKIEQLASAISFYLRSAERTNDISMQYHLLLRMAICFQILGERIHTELTLIQKALALCPRRPEAYFLASKLYERKKEWQESYTYAELGLEFADFKLPMLDIKNAYIGKNSMMFQKGLTSWYIGLFSQSQEIMANLKYKADLDEEHLKVVENNLSVIGYPDTHTTYESDIKENFQYNPNQRKGFWVVDNFYTDPDAIREFALKQEYHQGGLGRGYIGRRTYEQFLFPGLKEEFERIMGEKITAWEEHGMNGRFQYSMEGEPLVYHCDAQKWAAMIYLTPNAPLETGTGSFALKGTKVFHNSQEGIMAAFRGDGAQNLDKTLFEPVDSIGNVYNRLVIFNAGYLHAALGYFGYKPENARLWQMFFFD